MSIHPTSDGARPPSVHERVARFESELALMQRRARLPGNGDCWCVFKTVPAGSEEDQHRKSRFVQFWFHAAKPYFYVDLPNTTLHPWEASVLLRDRAGFSYARGDADGDASDEAIATFAPVQKRYEYGDERSAAEDLAYILFSLWRTAVEGPLLLTAVRADVATPDGYFENAASLDSLPRNRAYSTAPPPRPVKHLLHVRTATFEDFLEFFRRLTGKEPTAESRAKSEVAWKRIEEALRPRGPV
jgi:hypothetical protein